MGGKRPDQASIDPREARAMSGGLEGRRIALFDADRGSADSSARILADALTRAGATVHQLASDSTGPESDWHGGKYAALVIAASEGARIESPRLAQLMREVLVSEKPLAARGGGVRALVETGGAAGHTVAVEDDDAALRTAVQEAGGVVASEAVYRDGALVTARGSVDARTFAEQVIGAFADCLHEAAVDEMSDLSFPASDPPASTPGTIGRPSRPEDRAR